MTSESITTPDPPNPPNLPDSPGSRATVARPVGRSRSRIVLDGLRRRLGLSYLARVRRDPASRLLLRSGRADPYPVYQVIRNNGPLGRSHVGSWVSASHEVVGQVVRDRRFGVRPAGDVPPVPDPDVPAVLGAEWDSSFLTRDAPDHTRLRRLATPAFTPRRIAGYEPIIERVTHRLLDQAIDASGQRGGFDLMTGFASPLPVTVITELLGVRNEDVGRLTHYGNVLGASLDGVRTLRFAYDLQRTLDDLTSMFGDLIAERTLEPGDDVVSKLIADLGEDRLTAGELLQMCTLLLAAGFETTVNLIGNGVHALLDHPAQWQALRDDPAGMAPKVVEETLRYDSPVQVTGRIAHTDLELAGQSVRTNQPITLLLGGAGRDPEIFPDPQRYDLDRENSADHLAFSAGPHYCLGAALARMEGAVAFRALAERLPRLRRAGRPRRRDNLTLRGFRSLPVAIAR